MKTNFNYLTLMAVALLASFSSCSKDDEAGAKINETSKSLFLKISNSAPTTYAEGPPQEAFPVMFSFGDLYFTDAAGNIKQHYSINIGTTSATNINLFTLTDTGETITGLPGDVAQVYVVGNTWGVPTSGNISSVKAFARTVASQGTITDVNLYGEALTLAPPTSPATYYTATIALNPTVARVELTDMTARGAITGFKVAGVFVDNYYTRAVVDGTVAPADLKFNGPSTTAFTDGSTDYPTTLKPFVYDWYATPLQDASLFARPAGDGERLWGYNLFATAAGSTVPRLIIRLTEITTNPASGITYNTDQYITIKGFKKAGTSLTGIKAGEVYKIGTGVLIFDETDLTPTPNLSAIDVNVQVTLANWVPVSVTPEL